jgi:HEAT repeats
MGFVKITSKMSALLVVLLLMAARPASAVPIPSLNLTELTNHANLIVVGEVGDVRDDGPTVTEVGGRRVSARRMVVKLSIARVLKGRLDNTDIQFTFVVSDLPLGYVSVAVNQFGMFFLRETQERTLSVVSPYYPFIVAARDAPAAGGQALDQVVAELEHVVTSPRTAPKDRVRGITILDSVRTPSVTQALEQAAQAPYGPAVLYAVAALLKRNDILMLELAEKTLTVTPQTDELELRRMLAYSIRDGVSDPRALPVVTRLLKAEDIDVRRGAAAALRHIGTESVIEPLSQALNDDDREVRYQAVLGLASVTGQNDWGPSIDLFIKDESRYLTYWKDWLRVR